MKSPGLTISIAMTFVLVLCGALALGMFVMMVFWQRSLIHAEEERVLAALHYVELKVAEAGYSDGTIRQRTLQAISEDGAVRLDGLLYYNGQTVIAYPERALSGATEQIVRTAGLNRQEIASYRGSQWAILTPGRKTLIVARPIDISGTTEGALAAVVELAPIYAGFRKEIRLLSAYVTINVIIFSVIGLYRMTSMVVRPIERMARISESYSLSGGAAFYGDDDSSEFGRLSMALNSMLMRIELDRNELRHTVASLAEANEELRRNQQEMVQAEKFAAVGRLSAGLAHEIGNPLGIVQGYVELLRQPDVSAEDRHQFAQRALGELNRIDRLIRRLLDFARTQPRSHELFRLQPLFDELLEMFAVQARNSRVVLHAENAGDITLCGDRDGLKQVLLNCLLNSFDAIESVDKEHNGTIEIVVVQGAPETDRGKGYWITIHIRDNGVGVDSTESSLLFEPFYTTKKTGKGTGLGLSVSQAIIEAHGGKMRIDGKRGEGATVSIDLPAEGKGQL